MEEQLEAYRLRKRRKERFDQIKSKIISMIPLYSGTKSDTTIDLEEEKKPIIEEEKRSESPACSELGSDYVSEEDEIIFQKPPNEPDPIVPTNKYLRYVYWIVLILFWATCYAIALELKFGIVYLMFSALFGLYFNTRTGPKMKGEVSAYSVFNKDFKSIDGTLKAEQFEQEIRYGSGTVR
ncbi:SAYSvFN domain-containing protein 1 [Condylostylus longicornis]|uniref:SAYSvFN domain-containing protein 1 n=1 Tax=Condylostylus longicornis TaxID=2530218 RepID=UPI00244E4585|nr:SAYSvFN domain-containing protein 1 [Condylostylus longicornis]